MVDIKTGAILAMNNTALGAGGSASSQTIVETGAALMLAEIPPARNGGLQTGVQVWGEKLILNGPGNNTLGPLGPLDSGFPNGPHISALTILSDATIPNLVAPNHETIVPTDNIWRGAVTLNTNIAIDVQPGSRLSLLGAIGDA